MTNNKVAFLVLSCDKYSDLWEPFAQLFERYWTDCPFDRYFATNQMPFDKYAFRPILMGDDKTWSQGLINALKELKKKYDYVLITLEDLFIIEKVDTDLIVESINAFTELRGNYLRLFSHTNRKPHIKQNEFFSILLKNTPTRHTCVYSVWNINILLDVLEPTENAWEFEIKGAKRTASLEGFYASNKNFFVVSNTVVKGSWVSNEYKKIKEILPNIEIKRGFLPFQEEKILHRKEKIRKFFFQAVPPTLQSFLYKIKK